jgi:hypothetical protein
MGHTKNRLVEMMDKVAGTKLIITEEATKGTRILIKNVSPETIELGEKLPSPDTGDAATTMSTPKDIVWWKQEFIGKFGDEGYVEKGLKLPWSWEVVGNDAYSKWKNDYLTTKGNIMTKPI